MSHGRISAAAGRTTVVGGAAGQAVAIVAFAMVSLLLMLAVIVDGGNAWVQQRITQNGTDATAMAGATVLAQRLGGNATIGCDPTDPVALPCWDGKVSEALVSFAAANGIGVTHAYYTDICGRLLAPDGSEAPDLASAAPVGGGTLPNDGADTPDCDLNPPAPIGPAAGVRLLADRPFQTFIAKIIGINSFTANTQAIAVSGYLQGSCDTATLSGCAMIPLALPSYVTYCDHNGKALTDNLTDYPRETRIVIPICKNGPGNFGWIDWDLDDGYNGQTGLVACASGLCNPDYDIPNWLPIAMNGNPANGLLEDALNGHIGQVLMIPKFDYACTGDPDMNEVAGSAPYGCPDTTRDLTDQMNGFGGNVNWYHLTALTGFYLEHAYLQGNNEAECNPDWSPDGGSNNCLIGYFTDLVSGGQVGGSGGGPVSSLNAVGVQLIH